MALNRHFKSEKCGNRIERVNRIVREEGCYRVRVEALGGGVRSASSTQRGREFVILRVGFPTTNFERELVHGNFKHFDRKPTHYFGFAD